jgi:hypothetical protein
VSSPCGCRARRRWSWGSLAIVLSALVLFGVGTYQAVTLVGDWRKKGLQMVQIGLGAAGIGFLIGRLFHAAGGVRPASRAAARRPASRCAGSPGRFPDPGRDAKAPRRDGRRCARSRRRHRSRRPRNKVSTARMPSTASRAATEYIFMVPGLANRPPHRNRPVWSSVPGLRSSAGLLLGPLNTVLRLLCGAGCSLRIFTPCLRRPRRLGVCRPGIR